MSGYDYGNARLRAMKSRLLSGHELETLAEAGHFQALIAALTKTAYRQAIEIAMVRASGLDCILEALRHDLIATLGKIRKFYGEQEQEFVTIVLRPYDIHNLKAILRGVSKHMTPAEIAASLLPVGELTDSVLSELSRASGPRAVIDLLASMALPIALPLLNLRAEHPGAETPDMELALLRWHFREARRRLQEMPDEADILSASLDLEADLANLLTVLRFAHAPVERQRLSSPSGISGLRDLFVPPGHLSESLLVRAAEQNTLLSAVEVLAGTPYEPPLRIGLEVYTHSGRLSDFERALNRFRLHWMSNLIARNPLGIGVLLGYLTLKTNEVANVRWIARGIGLRLKAEAIKAGLELAA